MQSGGDLWRINNGAAVRVVRTDDRQGSGGTPALRSARCGRALPAARTVRLCLLLAPTLPRHGPLRGAVAGALPALRHRAPCRPCRRGCPPAPSPWPRRARRVRSAGSAMQE
eukprot:TRINITY_DN44250_c0_g1_i1.p3 TRINITY_DN44250_c0_g1~~TRINITY_DN44250_c0_g1_i1.p3  ORF type:complete len:112 (-),score=1.65 TRINITY_DN44250_c0_g1_i1:48-383(-)